MMMFHSPTLLEMETVEGAVDSRVQRAAEAMADQFRHKLGLRVHLQPMLLQDRRMLASRVRIIVVEAEVVSVVSTPIPEDDWMRKKTVSCVVGGHKSV